MFKRIKVVTILIIVLLTLGISQFLTGALSMRALVNDREGFQASQRANQSVAAFTDAWIMMNQTRIVVGTMIQNMMMGNADKDAMQSLLQMAKERIASSESCYKAYQAIPPSPGVDPALTKKLEDSYIVYQKLLNDIVNSLAGGFGGSGDEIA